MDFTCKYPKPDNETVERFLELVKDGNPQIDEDVISAWNGAIRLYLTEVTVSLGEPFNEFDKVIPWESCRFKIDEIDVNAIYSLAFDCYHGKHIKIALSAFNVDRFNWVDMWKLRYAFDEIYALALGCGKGFIVVGNALLAQRQPQSQNGIPRLALSSVIYERNRIGSTAEKYRDTDWGKRLNINSELIEQWAKELGIID